MANAVRNRYATVPQAPNPVYDHSIRRQPWPHLRLPPGTDWIGHTMESLGALGKRTEKVGRGVNAAIFEMRRIKNQVPYTQ